jgi:Fic family protein
MGAAPRLGIPAHGLAGLGLSLKEAAGDQPGGLEAVLAEVRRGGSWRRWLGVFLLGVEISAAQTAEVSVAALDLVREHMALIGAWVRAPRHPLRLLELMVSRPVVELPEVAEVLEVTQRTAGLLATKLKELGLVAEVTGQRRGRRFAYNSITDVLIPVQEP